MGQGAQAHQRDAAWVTKAIARVVGGIDDFLNKSAKAKEYLRKGQEALKKFRKAPECPVQIDDGPNSFTPDTRVVTADGSAVPIARLQVGQRVLATDPRSGRTEARAITKVIVGEGVKELLQVTVDTDGAAGNATGTVTATEGHPFWVDNRGRWLRAGDLQAGDLLLTPEGRLREVVDTREWTEVRKVYNLSVEGIHTYYVLVGGAAVLVHNSGGMEECGDAAYQGVLHIREEAEKERKAGKPNNHEMNMSDDELADYLDGYAGRGDGKALKGAVSAGTTATARSP